MTGRRGLPPDDQSLPGAPTPRRSAASPVSPPSPTSHPRRSATDPTTDATPGRGAWLGIVSLAVVLAIVVGALYLILGPFPRTEPPVPPGGAASRSSDPSPAPSASLPATDVPQSPPSAAASPGTTTPAPPVPSAHDDPVAVAAALRTMPVALTMVAGEVVHGAL